MFFPLLRKKKEKKTVLTFDTGTGLFRMNKEEGLHVIPMECVFFMLPSVNCNCGFPVHCPNRAEI